MKLIMVGTFFLCILQFFVVKSMEEQGSMEYKNNVLFDKALYITASIIAEMCHRKRVDLNNDKQFPFFDSTEVGITRTVVFSPADSEAINIFPYKEWLNVYSQGIKTLLKIWQDEDIISEASRLNETPTLLAIIKKLHNKSKIKLLKQINDYKPSLINTINAGFFSCIAGVSALYSAYHGYYTESIKMKAFMGGLATLSLLSSWYCGRKATTAYYDSSWWRSCVNFHKAIELCKEGNA